MVQGGAVGDTWCKVVLYWYIHKYNTRRVPKYVFAAAVIQQQQFTTNIVEMQEYINLVLHPDTGKTCTYKKLVAVEVSGQCAKILIKGLANEFGRLINRVGEHMQEGTNTIKFLPRGAVPYGRTLAYGNMVCDIRPQKAETHSVRLTVGETG